MQKTFGKLCATARDTAGYKQEDAAIKLNVSSRSMSDYERGKTIVPQDIVINMMCLYDARWLGYMYLKLANDVGKLILPNVEQRVLSSNILDLSFTMKTAQDIYDDLVAVGRDDVITPDEIPIFNNCLNTLNELCGAIFAIIFTTAIKKEKSPVLAHRRFM